LGYLESNTFGKTKNNNMKKLTTKFFALALVIGLASCTKNDDPVFTTQVNMTASLAAIQQTVSNLPTETLDDAEKARILFIREEEKLAYDVYQTMFDIYGVNVFQNIPNSELSHMEAMLTIIKKYNLTDPMETNARGVYANPVLQSLYTQLVSQGRVSLLAAYQVGATIEDLDISDLNSSLAVTNNQDVRLVYDFLNKGSRNHLRSFYKNIKNWNGTYTPVYITQAEFDAIVNSAMERF
jgi:hypothetical protein